MKFTFLFAALTLGALLLTSSTFPKAEDRTSGDETNLAISEDIQKIIDTSCYGCHNTNSKNEKGKKKLTFDTLGSMELVKLVGELGEIAEVVEKDEMPPAKFLEFKPEAKLTKEQKEALVKWAEDKAKSLLE